MPRLAINYSKTIIYRIVCRDPTITDCYVGSTTDFTKRKNNHKSACTNSKDTNYHYYVYQFIRDNGNWCNWDILEIEKYRAVDKPDQARRERYWLETYGATLNKQVPSRTETEYKKEYYEENKEQILEKQKEYNKEKITCECGSICRQGDISHHKKTKKHIDFIVQKSI